MPPLEGRALALGIGLGTGWALLRLMPPLAPLAALGVRSYAIFLFHVFCLAPVMALALHLGLGATPTYALALTAGLFGPYALEGVIRRNRIAHLLLLGVARK